MRIAAAHNHPDWSPEAMRAHVYLDGEYLTECVVADDEAGWVECFHVVDGAIVHDGRDPVILRRYGVVQIITPDINFDAWMRGRTNAAHAAYMARHSAGGQEFL